MKKFIKLLCLGLALVFISGCEMNTGEIIENEPFYSLQAAYKKKFLTTKNIKTINYLFYNDSGITLDEEVLNAIIRDYKKVYLNEDSEKKIIVNRYLGTYNGAVVLMIRSEKYIFYDMLEEERIAWYTFKYNNSQKILVWKENL